MPQEADSEYNGQIIDAYRSIVERVRNGRVPSLDQPVREALDVQTQNSDQTLTSDRADRLVQQYRDNLQDASNRLTQATNRERQQAVEETESAHEEALVAAAIAALLIGSSDESDEVPEIDQLIPDLRERIRLNINVHRGVTKTVEEMFSDVTQQISEDISESVSQAVGNMTVSQAVDNVTKGVLGESGSDFSFSRTVSSFRRIVSHEVVSIADEANKTIAALNPAVEGVRWRTSPRHHLLESSPDICDLLEANSPYDPRVIPAIPHPHCRCETEIILKDDISNWFNFDRGEVPDKPDITESDVGDFLRSADGDRTVTENYIQNQTKTLMNAVDSIYDNPRG